LPATTTAETKAPWWIKKYSIHSCTSRKAHRVFPG
jgi:hypothetical protein